ncbi:MAG: hypothetical protein EXX96DRAFT_579495 [Benjaminiella poitrasii]|nr:MAG: hypothetical protein EXX96DRAFT_579495 [Benjaminiella poitrasii]
MSIATPSLNRQNAFLLEESDALSNSLNVICNECKQTQSCNEQNQLIQPCQCWQNHKSSIYIHTECFNDWLKKNDYPQACGSCKSTYAAVSSPSSSLFSNIKWKVLLAIFVMLILYFCIHINDCLVVEILSKSEIYEKYGKDGSLRNVPESLILPKISASCMQSSYRSLQNHFISIPYFITIFFASFVLCILLCTYTLTTVAFLLIAFICWFVLFI